MTAKKKNPQKAGRKTLFSKALLPKLEILYRRGFGDKEVAVIIGVCEDTIHNWKKKHPKFFESLIDWKLEYDQKIVRSLAEKAHGYQHPETKFHYDSDRVYYDKHNNMCKGGWATIDTVKQYPPDTPAASLWLRNRLPKEWRDKIEQDLTVKPGKDSEGNTVTFNFKVVDEDGK
jgi:hypothetical protein